MFRRTYHTSLLTIFVFLVLPAAAIAFEMSSKRDCAICHIMWLDAFRSEQETLIEWQPGNVLMKDTQGVVSAEDICYSCHDGYVNDSRDRVWKYKRHQTFVKPSKNVTVPPSLPLSNRDEIYCGTCHTPHGTGPAPKGSFTGISSFLRQENIDSILCEACHTHQAQFARTNGHPLGATKMHFPSGLSYPAGTHAEDDKKIICQTCHRVHGARGDKIVVISNKSSELCTTCHIQQKHLLNTKHDLRLTMPETRNIKQQLPTESGPCGTCHVPHNAANKILWARRVAPGDPPSQFCLGCHSQENAAKVKWIGRHSHPVQVRLPKNMAVSEELPLFSDNADRDSTGKVQCFTCHAVHRWDPNFDLNTGTKEVEGDASNSFLRISASGTSTLCQTCHVDKKQVATSDHYLAVTAPDAKNIIGLTPKASGPCGVCHLPHNATGNKLWGRELSGAQDPAIQLCTGCHNKNGSAKAKITGANDHPVEITLDRLGPVFTADHLTDRLPLYDRNGNRTVNQNMVCMTCHEPHTWNPRNPQPDANYGFENMEGDNNDSFLRIANAPSSILCRFCHVDKAGIDGTVHDLNVSAPAAKNLRDQTVKTSGQCGVCHLVHNSPNKIALWSRPMGPIDERVSAMDALCTSCHSKGGLADKAIPRIADHPKEKLIINTILLSKERHNTTPVFDRNGRKSAVGNISCPSCHNAHQWGYLKDEKNASENSQGNGASRFLRTASYNTVCVNCHGTEAPLRYLYFHEAELRTAVTP